MSRAPLPGKSNISFFYRHWTLCAVPKRFLTNLNLSGIKKKMKSWNLSDNRAHDQKDGTRNIKGPQRWAHKDCEPIKQGWKLQNNLGFPSEKCRKDLPVRHYFCLSWTGKQTVIFTISAFPSEKCLKYLLVRLYFYLSRTGGQPVISIPGHKDGPRKLGMGLIRCLSYAGFVGR